MTWGYVAVAAATVVGGAIQSDSARKASNAQADATGKAVDATTAQADRAYADQAPYRDAGVQALGQYQTDINKPTTAADVMADPGYQFALDQGQQGIDRKFAASGGRISGASLKAASRFSTGQATSGYGAAYQRGQDRLNRLASLAGLGQTSTQASAQAGANTTNSIGNMMTAQGNAQGAYQIAQGNVWGNAGNQIAALYGRSQQPTGYTGNWQQNAQYGTVQGPYGP